MNRPGVELGVANLRGVSVFIPRIILPSIFSVFYSVLLVVKKFMLQRINSQNIFVCGRNPSAILPSVCAGWVRVKYASCLAAHFHIVSPFLFIPTARIDPAAVPFISLTLSGPTSVPLRDEGERGETYLALTHLPFFFTWMRWIPSRSLLNCAILE
jgi:hypothetical protein